MSLSSDLTIGRLAAVTRCSVPTIRYYEEIGLLPKASRRASGHRVYSAGDLRRLTFIRRCREFGFPIEQVRSLVGLVSDGEKDCTAARDLAQIHLDDVREKLKEMRALEKTLKALVVDCNEACVGGPAGQCVILEDLATPRACCGSARSRDDDCGSDHA